MNRLERIMLEYLYTLKWREYVLRRGRAALLSCASGVYPGFESLAQLYSLLGGLAKRLEKEGEGLRGGDPALWFFAMRYGDVERAARELARASVEVRAAVETCCEDELNLAHALSVTVAAWRDTVTAAGIIARRLGSEVA